MNFITDKIQTFREKLSSKGLDDPRLLGLVLLAFIGLSVVWNGARVVQQNYGLLKKITVLEEENRILELENSNKKIQIEYFKTPEFAELKARRVNGKASPGEKVYIITNDTAVKSLSTPEVEIVATDSEIEKPTYQKNFEAWMDFFFGDKSDQR
jgi:cell division protein FtsB